MVRGMERKEANIKWTNKKGVCRVAFLIEDEVFLLIRNREWSYHLLFNILKDREEIVNIERARILWEILIKKYGFREKNWDI